MKIINLGVSLYRFGLRNLFIQLRSTSLNIKPKLDSQIQPNNTSISDSGSLITYQDSLFMAVQRTRYFDNFRRLPAVRHVIDNVNLYQGVRYLELILKKTNIDSRLKLVLFQMDLIGKPIKFKFEKIGKVSPLSLRYLKVYLDLKDLFGDLSAFSIIEIGGGFGGQAFIINKLESISCYRLYDLPLGIALQKKYLEKLGTPGNFIFSEYPRHLEDNVDLVISNYAFCELNREIQKKYLDNVILKSVRGYMVWNDLGYKKLGSYSLAELIRLIPDSEILPDEPMFKVSNAIIVWGVNGAKKHSSNGTHKSL